MAGSRLSGKRPIALAMLVAASGALSMPAMAQTASKALVASQPSHAAAKQTGATPKLVNSWICASGMRLEVYPVSFDDPTAAPQYVVVYKQDGDVVASERIDARTAKKFPAYGCNDRDLGDHDLLG